MENGLYFYQSRIQHYNHKKYWKKRELVVNPKTKNASQLFIFVFYILKSVKHLIVLLSPRELVEEHHLKALQHYHMD